MQFGSHIMLHYINEISTMSMYFTLHNVHSLQFMLHYILSLHQCNSHYVNAIYIMYVKITSIKSM